MNSTTTQQTTTATAAFKVGDGATVCGYSDRHAGYIVAVSKSGKKVEWQYGTAKLLNGMDSKEPDALVCHPGGFAGHVSGTQRWEITPDANGGKRTFSLRGNGRWIEVGQSATGGARLVTGHSHHYDYNF